MVVNSEEIFIGRQPILDRNSNILGFELLFRSGDSSEANILDVAQASIGVIMKTLSEFGLKEIVGNKHQAFFNVNTDILMSDMIELLPKDQVVLELLETIEIDNAVVNRCRELKRMGFRLALDDFVYSPTYEPLFESIDIIKVDLLEMSPESIEDMIIPLKRWPLTLLAEKVEDSYQFDRTQALGFELFQGYYFARPSIISGKSLDPSSLSVMKLMDQVLCDAELGEIEDTFRESPSLSYNLLRLVNSVALGMRAKIESIRHAIVLLGREQINRWAQVLLFTHGESSGAQNPLLQTVVMRGRLMELLIEKGAMGGTKRNADFAFMCGILSLIDALLLRPMDEVISELSLAEPVCEALLSREGDLGQLLSLIEKLEQCDYKSIERLILRCDLDLSQLYAAEQEAAAWTKNLMEAF
ncbi:Predicted signal transduction protein [hydrothermal vent metagenome]|uniref:Predicted signal transduction protein n=1 Tax=hydrothermal vent metagenome TaxID=652676 RepID=A0A3B1DP11_9ZZZZ